MLLVAIVLLIDHPLIEICCLIVHLHIYSICVGKFIPIEINYLDLFVRKLTQEYLLNFSIATIAQIDSIPFDNLIAFLNFSRILLLVRLRLRYQIIRKSTFRPILTFTELVGKMGTTTLKDCAHKRTGTDYTPIHFVVHIRQRSSADNLNSNTITFVWIGLDRNREISYILSRLKLFDEV